MLMAWSSISMNRRRAARGEVNSSVLLATKPAPYRWFNSFPGLYDVANGVSKRDSLAKLFVLLLEFFSSVRDSKISCLKRRYRSATYS